MSVSSHRKLNVDQLINLAQVYWDDPGKLEEIGEAVEARMDPVAQLLFGAVNNRLERLRKDPTRALAEETPDLAALIAARLGKAPAPGETSAEVAASLARQEEKSSRRRVLPLLLLAALFALAVWWFWPAIKKTEEAPIARAPGIEIQVQGQRPEEAEERRGPGLSTLTGQRRPEFERPELDIGRRLRSLEEDEEEDDKSPVVRGRVPAAGAPREPESTTPESRAAAAANARDSGGGAAGGRGDSTAATGQARSAASPNADAGSAMGAAVAALGDAQLDCFLSDSRPNACGGLPAGGGRRGAAGASAGAGGAGGGGGGSPSASASPRSPSGAPASPATSPSAGSREQSQTGGSGGGGGGAGGGAGAGGSGSTDEPSSGRRAGRSAPGGGGGDDGKQSPPQQPQRAAQQQASVPPVADPDCPTVPPQGRVVFIFDGSISMGLPLGLDPAEEDRLDEGTRRRDPVTRQEYRALLRSDEPKRMARAQESFAEATQGLPDYVELGLVVFQECRDVRQVGVFEAARRGGAIDYIRSMIPHGRTPLAQSLMVAQEMLGDKPASIVLLTDGREFCGGDPCAVAEHVKTTRPGVPIHIIDIAGQGRTECVAEITGGRSYAPAETDDLTAVIRAAFRGAAPHCPQK